MTADDDGQDPVLDAIAGQVDGLVLGYVVLASYVDSDGEDHIFCDTLENQRNHTTLGLLAFGDAVERSRAVDASRDEDAGP